MKATVSVLVGVAGLLAWSVAPAWGQVAEPPRLEAVWAAYQQFDYATAQDLAEAALEAYEAAEDLAQIHIILGLIAFSQNEQLEANRQFTDALLLNTNAQLDSLQVSPKILTFFEEIRVELARAQRGDAAPTESPPRYVLVPDRRAEAALRSMVLPGWGQLYKGQRTKGRVLLGGWGFTLAGGVAAHFLRQQARSTYLDAGPADVEKRYDTFNQWHKTRNALLLGAAVIWVYGYLDALIMEGALPDTGNLLITPGLSQRRMHVSVQIRF